jgi:hypothetical protein
MEFYIGQTFDKPAPPEAAAWCNEHNAHIEKINGVRTIVKNPPSPETRTVRTFSKFSIWVATRALPVEGTEMTVWQAFETFLHEQNLWSGWAQLVDLVEDNPFFEEFYPLACDKLGKELVDRVLEASVTGTEEKHVQP